MRRCVPPSLALLVVLLAAVGSGCGVSGDENADPAKALPAGTLLSVSATIRPGGAQRDALDAAAKKIGRVTCNVAALTSLSLRSRSAPRWEWPPDGRCTSFRKSPSG